MHALSTSFAAHAPAPPSRTARLPPISLGGAPRCSYPGCELRTGLSKCTRISAAPDLAEARGAERLCMQCVMDTPFEGQAELASGGACGT
eukprot:6202354-Pleurochrysis_carterae.AAC.1